MHTGSRLPCARCYCWRGCTSNDPAQQRKTFGLVKICVGGEDFVISAAALCEGAGSEKGSRFVRARCHAMLKPPYLWPMREQLCWTPTAWHLLASNQAVWDDDFNFISPPHFSILAFEQRSPSALKCIASMRAHTGKHSRLQFQAVEKSCAKQPEQPAPSSDIMPRRSPNAYTRHRFSSPLPLCCQEELKSWRI